MRKIREKRRVRSCATSRSISNNRDLKNANALATRVRFPMQLRFQCVKPTSKKTLFLTRRRHKVSVLEAGESLKKLQRSLRNRNVSRNRGLQLCQLCSISVVDFFPQSKYSAYDK